MRVEPLIPDEAPSATAPADAGAFAQALDAVGALLKGATRAEDAFASGIGSLQDAMYQRASADVVLAVATSSASRLVQAMQSVLNMQV